jgi:hypothetical protein
MFAHKKAIVNCMGQIKLLKNLIAKFNFSSEKAVNQSCKEYIALLTHRSEIHSYLTRLPFMLSMSYALGCCPESCNNRLLITHTCMPFVYPTYLMVQFSQQNSQSRYECSKTKTYISELNTVPLESLLVALIIGYGYGFAISYHLQII